MFKFFKRNLIEDFHAFNISKNKIKQAIKEFEKFDKDFSLNSYFYFNFDFSPRFNKSVFNFMGNEYIFESWTYNSLNVLRLNEKNFDINDFYNHIITEYLAKYLSFFFSIDFNKNYIPLYNIGKDILNEEGKHIYNIIKKIYTREIVVPEYDLYRAKLYESIVFTIYKKSNTNEKLIESIRDEIKPFRGYGYRFKDESCYLGE